MNILKLSAASAVAVAAMLGFGAELPAGAVTAGVYSTKTFNCPASAGTPCKVVFNEAVDFYTDTISCQWSNPKVNLVQVAVLTSGTASMAVPFSLTVDERNARGMYRNEPSLPVLASQQLQVTLQASNSSANSGSCFLFHY